MLKYFFKQLYSTHFKIDLEAFKQNFKQISNEFERLLFKNKKFEDEFKKMIEDMEKKAEEEENDPKKRKNSETKRTIVTVITMLFIFYLALLYTSKQNESGSNSRVVSWNDFVNNMLAKGEVKEIIADRDAPMAYIRLHTGAIIKGQEAQRDFYTIQISAGELEQKLRKAEDELGIKFENRVSIQYYSSTTRGLIIVGLLLGVFLLYIAWSFKTAKRMGMLKSPMSDMFSGFRKAPYTMVNPNLQANVPTVKFKDVAGLKEAKVEIMEFVEYLKSPERFKKLGAKVPKGALLLGPPGCGKTLLAKALAAEAGVPFFSMAGTEFIEMIGGVGAARVRDLFQEARKHSPSIVFIDEIDAIGKKRSSGDGVTENSEMDQTLNQLLSEMDGLETIGQVIVLASTNRPDVLDKALLRPGRLDRKIMIDLPTAIERAEILNLYMKKLKLANSIDKKFVDELAHLTPRMSGADLSNVCNEAALHAARDAKNEINRLDFEVALEKILSGAEKKTSTVMKDEQKMIAYYESGLVLLSWLLESADLLFKVSIVQRTKSLALTRFLPTDKLLHSKEEIFEKMCLRFGGRCAESLVFNTCTTSK